MIYSLSQADASINCRARHHPRAASVDPENGWTNPASSHLYEAQGYGANLLDRHIFFVVASHLHRQPAVLFPFLSWNRFISLSFCILTWKFHPLACLPIFWVLQFDGTFCCGNVSTFWSEWLLLLFSLTQWLLTWNWLFFFSSACFHKAGYILP